MVRHVFTAALVAAFSATALAAGAKCGNGQNCPKETPCCSQYGDCGVGAYCLGGCDPVFSHQLDSCVTNPTCKEGDFKLKNLDDVQSNDKYLGDASKINWVSQGKPVIYNDALLLTMAEGTVGTLLASTHYVWYGKICAKMTTSQGKGVVTAFIMMSDVKDEIDFEFIGVDTATAQSNFYSQGITNYNNGKNLSTSNTVEKVHEYCIDWQPETLVWSIDSKDMRTLKKSETWNSTSNRFDYPQTPSRIQLSLWPAGLPSNAKGTIDWAGGEIDWNSKYMQNGYYYAMVQEVTVKCYDPPSGINKKGSKAYHYTDKAATNNTVEITDNEVILSSIYATGEDPKVNPNAASSSSGSKPTQTVETVPGGLSGGNRGENNSAQPSGNAGATGTAGGASPSSTGSSGSSSNNGNFQQNGKSGASEVRTGSSAMAVVVAMLGLFVL